MIYHDRRCTALTHVRNHAWLYRVWNKLARRDIILIAMFCAEHADLEYGAFDAAVQRMHMDRAAARPKAWKEIQEILMCVNSGARAEALKKGEVKNTHDRRQNGTQGYIPRREK